MIKKEEQVYGNVLIAKYMGWKIDNSFPDKDRIWRSPSHNIELDTTMKFHSDWEMLMPVCKKIIESYFDNRTEIFDGLHNTNRDETWRAVVKFIEFWNDDTQEKLTWNNK